ncbi:MAG: type IX secretion system membrane protein PorP/SprF, partial [Bacteroidales bacterium]|nr:type IX secretion system membrane protein PorP/SprF [Bacteroidales bacterium]
MKRSIIFIVAFLFTFFAWGQLQPLSNQYIFNGLAINPAYSGSREALSMTMLYRNQWVGLEGAPKTMSFSLHAPLRKEKIGLGLLIINDKIGV